MKYSIFLSLIAVFLFSDVVSANQTTRDSKQVSSLLRSSKSQSRNLSAWGNFLHFMRCRGGGPLDGSCSNGGGGGGNDGGGGGNGGGGGGNGGGGGARSSSWSRVKSWFSGSSDGNEGGGNGGGGGNNNNARSWTNWFTGGSGAGDAQEGENKNYQKSSIVRVGSFPWFVMVLSLVGLSTTAGYFAYQTSKNEDGVASLKTLREKTGAFLAVKMGRQSPTNDYKLSEDPPVMA